MFRKLHRYPYRRYWRHCERAAALGDERAGEILQWGRNSDVAEWWMGRVPRLDVNDLRRIRAAVDAYERAGK